MDQKRKIIKMSRGIFSMLAVGTLPVFFMNPLQYLFALIVSAILAIGLAFVLV